MYGTLARGRKEAKRKREKHKGPLQSVDLLQLRLQLVGAQRRQIRVAANVFLANVDVGDGALAGDLLESVLDAVTVALLVQLVDLFHP